MDVWGSFPLTPSATLAANTNYRYLLPLSILPGGIAEVHKVVCGISSGVSDLNNANESIRVGFTEDQDLLLYDTFNDPRQYGKMFYHWFLEYRISLATSGSMSTVSQPMNERDFRPPKKIVGLAVNVVARTGARNGLNSVLFGVYYTVRRATKTETLTIMLRQKRFREEIDRQRLAVGLI